MGRRLFKLKVALKFLRGEDVSVSISVRKERLIVGINSIFS